MNVIIAGGTGFLGTHLYNHLSKQGHRVKLLSRHAKIYPQTITWSEIKASGLPPCDVIVNVSGENAFKPFFVKPFNDKYKSDIISSRTGCNNAINEALSVSKECKPKVFISASAIGIYASKLKETLDESSQLPQSMADNFMVKMVGDWESSAYEVGERHGCRVACMRIGLVLGVDGGMLQQVKWQYFFGAGGQLSDGTQPFPWIHVDDAVASFEHVMKNESIEGPVNVVAPGSVKDTGATFNSTIANVMNRWSFMRTPKMTFDLMFGKERSDLMFSKSVVEPKILTESGFEFKFSKLDDCLQNLLG